MTAYTKQYYSIGEVSKMLDVPIYTLRFWETQFPLLNPARTPKGTRKYSQKDIELLKLIKEAVYTERLHIESAVKFVERCYRRSDPRNPFKCPDATSAIALLRNAQSMSRDKHVVDRIEAVIGWLEGL